MQNKNKNKAFKMSKYSFKKTFSTNSTREKLRQNALATQRNARNVIQNDSRQLKQSFIKISKTRRSRYYWCKQLQYESYMIDIADNLVQNFGIKLRPKGIKCLLISSHGITISRRKNGQILHRFCSKLPNGNYNSYHKNTSVILECIYNGDTQTYYILDLMCWNDYQIYASSALLRYQLLKDKLQFLYDDLLQVNETNEYRIEMIPFDPISLANVQQVYQHKLCQGILFYHYESTYMLGQINPLVLLWQDLSICSYLKEIIYQAAIPMLCKVLPQVNMNVLDDNPNVSQSPVYPLYSLDSTYIHYIHINELYQLQITNDHVNDKESILIQLFIQDFNGKHFMIAQDQHFKKVSLFKMLPDSFLKIIFYLQLRSNKAISIQHLIDLIKNH